MVTKLSDNYESWNKKKWSSAANITNFMQIELAKYISCIKYTRAVYYQTESSKAASLWHITHTIDWFAEWAKNQDNNQRPNLKTNRVNLFKHCYQLQNYSWIESKLRKQVWMQIWNEIFIREMCIKLSVSSVATFFLLACSI